MKQEAQDMANAGVTSAEVPRLDALAVLGDALSRLGAPMALFDDDLCFVAANAAWRELFYDPGDPGPAQGTHTYDITRHIVERGLMAGVTPAMHSEAARGYAEQIKACTQNLVVPLSDGRWLSCSSNRTELGGYLLVFRDITAERADAEARQAAVENAIETLSVGIALWDDDFRFVLGNRRYYEMWFPSDLAPPTKGEPFRAVIARVAAAGQMHLPEGITADQMVDTIVSASNALGRDFLLTTPRGTLSCAVLPSPLGGYLHEFVDITERLQVEAELERQRELAHQSEKLSALGELLAGVAHELNNPLGIAQGYAQLLEGRTDLPAEAAEQIGLVARATERSTRIVRTFLAMARQRPVRMERIDMAEVLRTALDVSAHGLRARGADVVVTIDEPLPAIMGDFDQLAQVVSNLVINADHALSQNPEPGRVAIAACAAGDVVSITIADDGPGIAPEVLGRIFEPFFTTKDVGDGTGVGLAFCHRVVTAHDGTLTARSDGQGANFEMRLPFAPPAKTQPRPDSKQKGFGRRVLVIDDEPALARLMAAMLHEAGYHATGTSDPHAALRLLDQGDIDAVVSDVRMPDLDGPGLWRMVQRISPRMARRVGFVTGDALASETADFLAATGQPHIDKPILHEELLALVAGLCSNGADQ